MHKKTAADAAAFSTEEINQCCAQQRLPAACDWRKSQALRLGK